MTIQTAKEAVALTEAATTIDEVLGHIEFAAKKGQRSWLFATLSPEVRAELKTRGFTCVGSDNSDHVSVMW